VNYRDCLGAVAVLLGFISYIPYYRNIFSGKTKPHAFTWLVWTVLNATAFFGQVAGHGGAGTWATATASLMSLLTFFIALKRGYRDFPPLDYLSLAGAGLALVLWAITGQPLLSIVLVVLVDTLGFIPTFRKSIKKPYQETASTYIINGIKFAISIIALQHYSLLTILYPAFVAFSNMVFVGLLYVRRVQLSKKSESQ
jgi:hypothetical protein